MTIKQMIFALIIFGSTDGFIFSISLPEISHQGDFVFDKGKRTKIKGNDLSKYFCCNGYQENPTPVFGYTKVVECVRDKEFKEIKTLGSLEKIQALPRHFAEHIRLNNVIYCDDVEQREDYDGNLQSVGAIIYGTQNLERCSLFREYFKQQKLAANSNKSEVVVIVKD